MLKVIKIHRRALRVVSDDYNSTCEELLPSHNDISIHLKHLKHLAIEIYKVLTNLNPKFIWSFSKNKSIPYSLRMLFASCTIVSLRHKFSTISR